jgi:cobalt-zinc-cadmium efflux system protein
MMGSGAALLAGLVILATRWMPIDPLLSAVVAVLMIRSGWRIALESAHILLEGAPDGLDPTEVESTLRAVIPQLDEVHHLHSWSLTDERPIVTLHAKLKLGSNSDQCIQDITRVLERSFNVSHATIQIEFDYCNGRAH